MGVTILLSGLCAQGLCRDKDFRGCNNFMKKSNKRLNIGFFTCHLDNDYAYEVCKGVDYAAKELDVNLIVFPGMYMNASYNDPKNAYFVQDLTPLTMRGLTTSIILFFIMHPSIHWMP